MKFRIKSAATAIGTVMIFLHTIILRSIISFSSLTVKELESYFTIIGIFTVLVSTYEYLYSDD